jgi:hypothetical protein
MRLLLTLFASIAFLVPKAQNHYTPFGGWGPAFLQPYIPFPAMTAGPPGHLLQIQPFASVSTGYWFLNGGLSYFSAPVGIMVYRPLNKNFTGFGAATVTPTVFHFNSLYDNPTAGPFYPGSGATHFSLNAGVTGGVIYTNDAKTFSVSGSISVERGSYPTYTIPRSNTIKKY